MNTVWITFGACIIVVAIAAVAVYRLYKWADDEDDEWYEDDDGYEDEEDSE